MIRVEPVRVEWLEALAAGDDAFRSRFGITVVEGWAGFPEAIPAALEQARARDRDPWGFHLLFDNDGSLVGLGGWKGHPVNGVVELGYSVAPARQGRGIATAAVHEFISRARAAGLASVVAHTLPESSASTSVLKRCGFRDVGEVPDPDGQVEGGVRRWELPLRTNDSLG
jgi:RimJ/RimL family protein N-acetyltransferase